MKKIILALAFCALTSTAHADATITFALSGAGPANTSKPMILSDADGARVLAWAKDAYGPVVTPPIESNPLVCNVVPGPPQCSPASRPLTNKEAIEAVFEGLFTGLRNNVKSYETAKASKTANDGISTIVPK